MVEILILSIVLVLVLASILFFMKSNQEKLKENIKRMRDHFFWNGAILTFAVICFKHAIKSGHQFKLSVKESEYLETWQLVGACFIFICLSILNIWIVIFLKKKKELDVLNLKETKARYGNLYA